MRSELSLAEFILTELKLAILVIPKQKRPGFFLAFPFSNVFIYFLSSSSALFIYMLSLVGVNISDPIKISMGI